MDISLKNNEMPVSSRQRAIRVLLVDDDRLMRIMIQEQISALGYEVDTAVNGIDALTKLKADKSAYDIIILDREMPEMNGLEVLANLRADRDLRKIPAIMATGSDRPEDIKTGIDAGAFYYLTKPIDEKILKSVISSAIRKLEIQKTLKNELQKHKSSFNLITSAKFKLKTREEAEDLSAFLANCFPEPERVITGIAELITNAVEHGNLAISYDEKTRLIETGTWKEEIDRRLQLEEYKDKYVHVALRRTENELKIRITDEGAGFEWQRFLKIDPSHASDNHGRGIAQANAASFDSIQYNPAGNQVIATVNLNTDLEW